MMTNTNYERKLFVVEGIDGAGKGTCVKNVAFTLRSQGISVATFSFPQYCVTACGKRLGLLLNNPEIFAAIPPFEKALLFAMDRKESLDALQKAAESSDVLLVDRYVPSNMVYAQAATNLADKLAIQLDPSRLARQMAELEYNALGIPHPRYVFVLDMPVHFATKNIEAKLRRDYTDKQFDANESNAALLRECSRLFRTQLGQWHDAVSVVECITPKGELRDVSDIAKHVASRITLSLNS